MKKKVTILAAVLLVLGWYQTVDTVFGAAGKCNEHKKNADDFAEKEIYEDALEEYQLALGFQPESAEIKRKIAEMNLYLDDTANFITGCEELIYGDTVDAEALKMLIDYYEKDGEEDNIVSLLMQLRQEHGAEDIVQKEWEKYQGSYEELYYSYQNISPFYGNCAIAVDGEKQLLINSNGENAFGRSYDTVGNYSKDADLVAVSENGTWYYINGKGHKKVVPDEKFEFLGMPVEEYAVVKKDGKYGYADMQLNVKAECIWENASNFCNGIAAVQKNGKWALLDNQLSLQTDYIYEDILMDEARFCSGWKRIFVRQKDGYHLLDIEGNEVGDLVFEDARPFSNDNMTAVCIKGKWGFIDTEGILVIPCEFEDAKTFANGMAPIKKDGKWGYIDTSGNIVVKAEFEDAYPFNSTGTAPVKQDDWFLIRLYALQ